MKLHCQLPQDPERILRAAKLAIALMDLARDAFWSLYAEEILSLTQENERELAALLAEGLEKLKNDF
jgi:hypothetical protein